MHTFVTTSGNIDKLSVTRSLVTDVLKGQRHTHGNGQRVPPTTLDTWERVEKHYDLLCRKWGEALEKLSFGNQFSSSESRRLVNLLRSAVKRECHLLEITDDITFSKYGEGLRWDGFKENYDSNDFVPSEVAAYRAIRDLQNYTKGRGWSTDEDFGEMLGAQELDDREQITHKHLVEVSDSIWDECVGPLESMFNKAHEEESSFIVHDTAYEPKAKVKELCDFLCRHWDEALKQKEKSTKAFNLLASSKVKRSIETLHSAIAREDARQTATDDERHRLEWEAKPEHVRLRSERALWAKIMAYKDDYPSDWAVPSPGVEAYRTLSKLLELTKEKGWVTDNEPGILMNESELAELDRIFRDHGLRVKTNTMGHLMFLGHKDKAEIDQSVNH